MVTRYLRSPISSAHIQRAWIDNVGGGTVNEVNDIVECGTEVRLVAVALHIADVWCANAVLQPQQGVPL